MCLVWCVRVWLVQSSLVAGGVLSLLCALRLRRDRHCASFPSGGQLAERFGGAHVLPISMDDVGPYLECKLESPEEEAAFPLLKQRLYNVRKVREPVCTHRMQRLRCRVMPV